MIQYVLTYYPNVGASKRETANTQHQHGGTQPARGGRAGAAAGRRGRPAATSRAALRLDP